MPAPFVPCWKRRGGCSVASLTPLCGSCAPAPGGYLHALIYKSIPKPLQVLKGCFLCRCSLPLNLHLKQLCRSLC